MLLILTKCNFPAIDFAMTPDCLFQVTVSETHPIMHHHLVNIVEHMPAYLQDKKTKIQFYFVVPEDKYDNFQYQKLETETRNEQNVKSTREIKRLSPALKYVEQWALKIPTVSKLIETSSIPIAMCKSDSFSTDNYDTQHESK